jgi:hypothetical protein
MKEKGRWNLGKAQNPTGCQFAITDANYHCWKEFVTDVNEAVEEMKKKPELNNTPGAAIYGVSAKIPDTGILLSFLETILEI